MATGSYLTQNHSRSQSEIQGDLHKRMSCIRGEGRHKIRIEYWVTNIESLRSTDEALPPESEYGPHLASSHTIFLGGFLLMVLLLFGNFMATNLLWNVDASRFNGPDGRQGCVLAWTVESNQGCRFDGNESVADSFRSGAVNFKTHVHAISRGFFPSYVCQKTSRLESELAARGHPFVHSFPLR
ncbi:hypothetical protein TNCV_4976861 [Trichonephila clavipes]|nr:hypothetical protein TNCV_4976861 [Trichonephila clavipes]